jgi:hypothetical protein
MTVEELEAMTADQPMTAEQAAIILQYRAHWLELSFQLGPPPTPPQVVTKAPKITK